MKNNTIHILVTFLILTTLLPIPPAFANQRQSPAVVNANQRTKPTKEYNLQDVNRLPKPAGIKPAIWQDIQRDVFEDIHGQTYLKASNTNAGDYFGWSVGVSCDTIVIGARFEASAATGVNGDQENNDSSKSGAAYVFVRVGSTWVQQAYLKASNTDSLDFFGWSVAISGNTIVVGANGEDSDARGVNSDPDNNDAPSSGAAYVFVRNGTTWSQQAYLKASNTDYADFFGEAVAISGDTIIVGAPGEDSTATGINGDQNNNSSQDSGAAYIFVRSGISWSQQAYLKASNTDPHDKFGSSVAVSDWRVVVGAPFENSNSTQPYHGEENNDALNAGAAYIFGRHETDWSQQAYLKASNTDIGDRFGCCVDISEDTTTVVVGALYEDSSDTGVNGNAGLDDAVDSGAVYVFEVGSPLPIWGQQAYIKASNTGSGDKFGSSVAISEDTIVVGASGEDNSDPCGNTDDNASESSGSVYIFAGDDPSWKYASQTNYLKGFNFDPFDYFGEPVAVSGCQILIGAHGEDSKATGVNGKYDNNEFGSAGAAYVYNNVERLFLPLILR
jgi:hypothetical protein